jgi:hypothetical protein
LDMLGKLVMEAELLLCGLRLTAALGPAGVTKGLHYPQISRACQTCI